MAAGGATNRFPEQREDAWIDRFRPPGKDPLEWILENVD